MDFHSFATRVHKRFVEMSAGELYEAGDGGDNIFARYLRAFPEGSNPIYKTHTWHDCTCCKHFMRTLGRVVSIKDGKVKTVWGISGLEYPYKEVAEALDDFVSALPVRSIFRTNQRSYGNEFTRQLDGDTIKRWEHFHGVVAPQHYTTKPDEDKGLFNTTMHVFRRGLEELKPHAFKDVLDLIANKSLYRGEEHSSAVRRFQKLQREYLKLPEFERTLFVLTHSNDLAVRFRNSAIGTLVQDLSEGKPLEDAVRAFERIVAPENYKRSTALITPRMVEDALKTINELGLEQALERRLARISDISVNNVIWVDRAVKGKMKSGIESVLLAATKPKAIVVDGKTPDITIEQFIKDVLPDAISVGLYVRNTHTNNFMTLTAPVHPDTGKLFRWNNDFAWSYDGNITDSIREKVKAAGGNIEARLRFSLAWYNYDDLDIHVREPNDNHVYFGNKDGKLDVDMNYGSVRTRQPVENVSFSKPLDGIYIVWVNQYNHRETDNVGFSIEIASASGVVQLSYLKGMPTTTNVAVGSFKVKDAAIVESKYAKDILSTGIAQDKWNIKTESLVPVQTIMLSPNYWDDNAVGNKHWFFILKGCRVDGAQRGIYNEFLTPELQKHSKVFEVLGNKTKCPVTEEQLSGLGFSSTRGDTVTVSVESARGTRQYNIKF